MTFHYSPTDKHDKRNCAAVLVEEEFSLFEATIEPAACRYTVLRWVHHTVFGIRKENSLGPRTGPLPLPLPLLRMLFITWTLTLFGQDAELSVLMKWLIISLYF